MGSHWEITVIFNEIMVSKSISTHAIFSLFTIALLKDTGYYFEVNDGIFNEPSFYGKNMGCEFILGNCNNFKREFCD